MEHEGIPLLSSAWWVGLSASFLLIAGSWALFAASRDAMRRGLAVVLGAWILLEFVLTHVYVAFVQGTWSLADSLPLHLCRISFPVAGLCLLFRGQDLYEWLVYIGLPGGLYSILTPELTQGNAPWMLFDYYCSHSLMIVVPIIMSVAFGMRPRKNALVRMLVIAHVLAAVVFPLNFVLKSNYMYLAEKPVAENPLFVGPWPWYILSLEVVVVLHFLLMDLLFRIRPYRRIAQLLLPRAG